MYINNWTAGPAASGPDQAFALTTGIPVEYPSLAAAFNNTGISDDSDAAAAIFDGAGYSYSRQGSPPG